MLIVGQWGRQEKTTASTRSPEHEGGLRVQTVVRIRLVQKVQRFTETSEMQESKTVSFLKWKIHENESPISNVSGNNAVPHRQRICVLKHILMDNTQTRRYSLGGIQDQPSLEVTLSSGKPRRFWWLSKHPVQSWYPTFRVNQPQVILLPCTFHWVFPQKSEH